MILRALSQACGLAALFIVSLAIAAPGDPDPTFGTAGQVILKRGTTLFENEGFALQADGKLLVPYVGRSLNAGYSGGLVRYNPDGTVDTAFGYKGQVFGTGTTVALSGSLVLATARTAFGSSTGYDYIGVNRFTAAGALDTTFGVNGRTPEFQANLSPDIGDDQYLGPIVVAPDGKIVVAGVARNAGSFFEVLVVRYNANGTLDTGFGTNGWIRFAPLGASNHHQTEALVVLADGAVVISGTKGEDHGDTGFVAKLTPAGVVDTGWATSGYYTIADRRHCMGLAADGAGLVVACDELAATSRYHVFRLAGTGALDAAFDSTLKTPPDSPTVAGGVPAHLLKLPDGRFLISGSRIFNTCCGTVEKFTLLALTSTGAIDTTFAANGWYYDSDAAFGPAFRYARAAAWNGASIDVVGKRLVDNRFEVVLANFSSTGVLNSLTFDNPVSDTSYFRVKALADGRLFAAGSIMMFASPGDEGRIATQMSRYSTSGALDPTFGAMGHTDLPFATLGGAGLRDADFVSGGNIVWTGDFNGTSEFGFVGVGKVGSGGGYDLTFNAAGTPGYNRLNIGAPFARNLKVQTDGKIVVTGSRNPPVPAQMAVVRFNADGTLDTTYGASGVAASDFPAAANPRYVALDASDRAIVVGNNAGGVGMTRFTTAGIVDTSFGTSGRITHAMPSGVVLGLPNKVTVLPDGKLLTVFSGTNGPDGVIGVIRTSADGALDASFGTGGMVTVIVGVSPNPGFTNAWDMVVLPNGRFVVSVGNSATETSPRRTTLVRFNPNGSLDAGFGSGGFRHYLDSIASLTFSGIDAYANGALALAGGFGAESVRQSIVMKTVADPGAVLPLTVTSLGASANPSTAGQNVTFTATITGGPGSPTGTVDFRNGPASIPGCGAVAVSAGQAVCTTNALPVGVLSITAIYSGDGSRLGSASAPLGHTVTGVVVASSNDFNQDGKPDLIWTNTVSGGTYIWRMNGVSLLSDSLLATIDPVWKIQGVGDFNGDGHNDVIYRHTGNGNTYVWYLVNGVFQSDAFVFNLPPEWVIQGVADFNADGKPDFLMRNTVSGNAFAWYFNNNVAIGDQFLFNIDPSWKVEGVADLNADNQPDLLFRNVNSGLAFAWNSQFSGGNLSLTTSSPPIFSIDYAWEVVQVADWNADSKPDLVFRNKNTGVVFVWYLDGITLQGSDFIIQIDPSWEIVPRR